MAFLFTALSGTTSAQINDNGDLVISASPASSSGDFDFLLGAHRVHHNKLRHRLANSNEWVESEGTHTMQTLLGGSGNIEQHHMVALDESWEWNWYMYFSKSDSATVGVLELRDYLINQGQRDRFIDYFEANLIAPQWSLGGYVLGRYRVKNNEDNFFWMRGFESMKSRSAFLPAFYHGDFWKQHKKIPNGLLANNDNVYLLRPLMLIKDSLVPANSVSSASLNPGKGIAVIDFYISNTKLDKLLKLFANEYLPLWGDCGINRYTLWVSEMEKNDFPILPVFQDKNLLVVISFFQNELDYSEKMGLLKSKQNARLTADLLDAVTTKNTIILYPIENCQSF